MSSLNVVSGSAVSNNGTSCSAQNAAYYQRPKLLQQVTTHVQLLQWLHGEQQQQHTFALRVGLHYLF